MKSILNLNSIDDYHRFLRIKSLPTYRFCGREAFVPDEYASLLSGNATSVVHGNYEPWPGLFDYQQDIARLAIRKRKFSVFADPGLGKTFIMGECVRHALPQLAGKRALLVSPLMVIGQTIAEYARFYGPALRVRQIAASELQAWLDSDDFDGEVGIVNFEAITEGLRAGKLGFLAIDESSMMKSHYGKWGTKLVELGRGLEWKFCFTGTPAPNDRIEYANHAVFCDAFPNVNSFLAKFFVNRGQTNERWELRPHALKPFYRALSHWCIFLSNPATYGWKDNAGTLPPINVTIHDVPLTQQQAVLTTSVSGRLFASELGGIATRASYGQIAKGHYKGEAIATNKPAFIKSLVDSWPEHSTIIWCIYNEEQRRMAETFPDAKSIDGNTPLWERLLILDWYKEEICHCEFERRRACGPESKGLRTTANTTSETSTSGLSEQSSSVAIAMPLARCNMPQTANCERQSAPRSRTGKNATLPNEKLSDFVVMESPSTTTDECASSRKECAPSAVDQAGTSEPIDSTSITITQPERCEGSSAQTAITPSANLETVQKCLKLPQPTCDCINKRPKGRILISKAKVLGFGLNLQVTRKMVFSGLQDSYESYYQCVKRANRIGSTEPLDVHIPITEIERPMIETVLAKAKRVQQDTEEQEAIFKESGVAI